MKTQVTDDGSRVVLKGENVNHGPMGLNYCDYYVAIRENNDGDGFQEVAAGLSNETANKLFDTLVKRNKAVDWAIGLYGGPLGTIPEYYYEHCQHVRIGDFYFDWKEALDIRYAKKNFQNWGQCPECGCYFDDDACWDCGDDQELRPLETSDIDDLVLWLGDVDSEYTDSDIIDALLNEGYNAYLKYKAGQGVNNGSN